MAFEGLSEKLNATFKHLRGKGRLSEEDIKLAMREVRLALLEADVSYKVVKDFVKTVSERAVGAEVLDSLTPAQQVIKIVNEELVKLMGSENQRLSIGSKSPSVVMLVGLQGAGKTTLAGKLGYWLKDSGHTPLLVAADLQRPNAVTQLQVVGERAGVPVYAPEKGVQSDGGEAVVSPGQTTGDPVKVARDAVELAKQKLYDTVIIDTAGRLAVDEEMMNEIAAIKSAINPNEILFVVDSMTGQDAVNTAKEFNERLDFNGVVLTKLDGDTRGGAALSIRTVVNKPIKFVGTGEKLDAIDQFHPARMADRILGMGDIVSLVERAQEQYDEEEAKRLQKKIAKNQFDFNDFLSQIAQIKKMGNLKELASMIPGVGKAIKDIDIDDNAFKSIEAIIYSMTPEERSNPAILNGSRRQRIAKGSGTNIQEVNRLLKQFDQTRKMMKMVTGSKMGKMMPKLKR